MMRINTMNCLNQIIIGLNKIGTYIEETRDNYQENESGRVKDEVVMVLDDAEEILQDEFHSVDISFTILVAHLERTGKRAIELGDEQLIRILKDMCIITEEKEAA